MAKTLVVYYSQSRDNTKKIAREIASTPCRATTTRTLHTMTALCWQT